MLQAALKGACPPLRDTKMRRFSCGASHLCTKAALLLRATIYWVMKNDVQTSNGDSPLLSNGREEQQAYDGQGRAEVQAPCEGAHPLPEGRLLRLGTRNGDR